jgi:DNA-binding CsgD family transcriptional regulator
LLKIGLEEKKIIGFEKNMETLLEESLRLQQLANESYGEVIQLAKTNDPSFVARFKEVYSEFWTRMVSLKPLLTDEELKFCAMLYLNFSTKDIAKFTFVQTKTVQMKKYRLKKKLNLSQETDLNEWLKSDRKSQE